jgi:hypothetical protein
MSDVVIPHLTDEQRTNIKRTFELIGRYGIDECRTEFDDLMALLDETIEPDAPLLDRVEAYEALFRDVFFNRERHALVADEVEDIVNQVLDDLDGGGGGTSGRGSG